MIFVFIIYLLVGNMPTVTISLSSDVKWSRIPKNKEIEKIKAHILLNAGSYFIYK